MKEELTEYGRDFVEKRMVELSRYAAKQDRLIFAYEDAAVSFANFGPFDPRGRRWRRTSRGASSLAARAVRRSCKGRTGRTRRKRWASLSRRMCCKRRRRSP